MIKVALLLEDQGFANMNLSRPEEGNPGVGGTAYCFLLLGRYLAEEKDTIEITFYHFNENNLMKCKQRRVKSIDDALAQMKKDGIDIVILKNLQSDKTYDMIEAAGIKTIIWAHNFLTFSEMKLFARCETIKRVICVGRQMYDYYLDEPVIQKMDYVFNIFLPPQKEIPRTIPYEKNVTYIGSLVYEKNFHVLAQAWKEIVAAVPEAKLQVIGSGQLYSRESSLGQYGIAQKEYEDLFMPYICTQNGELMPSVVFHGLLGDEKYQVFANTAVGVVNPMAATETFCLCAVELESCGIPVVTRRKNGLLDTVIHRKTGLLYRDAKDLARNVIRLLKDQELNQRLGLQAMTFAHQEFVPTKCISRWRTVLNDVYEERPAMYHAPQNHYCNNGKWIRRMVHGLHSIKLLAAIPSIHDIQKK